MDDRTVVLDAVQDAPAVAERRKFNLVLLVLTAVAVLGLAGLVFGVVATSGRTASGAEPRRPAIWDTPGNPGNPGEAGPVATAGSSSPTVSASASVKPSLSISPAGVPSAGAPAGGVPSGTPSGTPTRQQGAGPVDATYGKRGSTATTFAARVTLVNTADVAQGWRVELRYPDGTALIGASGGADVTASGGAYGVTGSQLGPGETRTVELFGTKIGQNEGDFTPSSCTVNGRPCG